MMRSSDMSVITHLLGRAVATAAGGGEARAHGDQAVRAGRDAAGRRLRRLLGRCQGLTCRGNSGLGVSGDLSAGTFYLTFRHNQDHRVQGTYDCGGQRLQTSHSRGPVGILSAMWRPFRADCEAMSRALQQGCTGRMNSVHVKPVNFSAAISAPHRQASATRPPPFFLSGTPAAPTQQGCASAEYVPCAAFCSGVHCVTSRASTAAPAASSLATVSGNPHPA